MEDDDPRMNDRGREVKACFAVINGNQQSPRVAFWCLDVMSTEAVNTLVRSVLSLLCKKKPPIASLATPGALAGIDLSVLSHHDFDNMLTGSKNDMPH